MNNRTKALLLDLIEVLKKHNAYVHPVSSEFGESWIDIGFNDDHNDGVELETYQDLDVECIESLLNK